MIKCENECVSIHGQGDMLTYELVFIFVSLIKNNMPEDLILRSFNIAKSICDEKNVDEIFEMENESHEKTKEDLAELFRKMKQTDSGRDAISELVEIIKEAMVGD